jgi:hypothetical protein
MKRENGRRQASARPTPEEFIRAWQTSRTLREACKKLRMKRAVARLRAMRYRRRGVPLKEHELEQGVELLPDWEELAEYAASLVPAGEAANDAPADEPEAGTEAGEVR